MTRALATLIAVCLTAPVSATWSICIVDVESREVAVGTVTCLNQFDLLAIVPVVVVGEGGAAVQAAGDFAGIRRPIIFDGFVDGTPVADIFALLEPIADHEDRQYGIVNTSGQTLTFTGADTFQWAGGVTGSLCTMYYAIQGNILAGGCVVPAIEQAIRDTPGDIPTKLMAGMQAAHDQGGDGRCSCSQFDATACGCPPPVFAKAGHIGGMIVARIGDIDDTVCNAGGCADGDYFMRLNVAFQIDNAPDPVEQLQSQFDAWRAGLAGRPDAVHSTVSFDPPTLPPDGVSQTTMTITLLDSADLPITSAIKSLSVQHAPGSAGGASIGPVSDQGGGVYQVVLTAGMVAGIDRLRIAAADGIRPVTLMPEPLLESCDGECTLDCNDNGVLDLCDIGDGISGDCNANGIPDECEISAGASDCDGNGVPDECEDCNGNGLSDACDIADETSPDIDGNGVPDECHGVFLVPTVHGTIQSALDAAVDGDTVLVADGNYGGAGNVELDFAGKAVLLKAQAAVAPSGAGAATLDGGGTSPIAIFDDGEGAAAVLEGFTITNGSATSGGGVSVLGSSPTLRRCTFTANTAGSLGGAVFVSGTASPLVDRCLFIANTAGSRGGAMHVTSAASPVLRSCLLADNDGGAVGGGVSVSSSDMVLEGCTVTGNVASSAGGAFYVTGPSTVSVSDCILSDDTAPNGPEITLATATTSISVAWSIVEGGPAAVSGPGTPDFVLGNLDADPQFLNAAAADWRLSVGSPAIDAGDPSFVATPGATDAAGAPRVSDGDGDGTSLIDMGSFERLRPGDLDGDGVVGIVDLLGLLAAWGSCPTCDADLDGDGVVGITDLLALLAAWGTG